ncbi:MAG TPA: replication-associated recombination protein A, partial [bacterium]|nr:replication-associated recombination protein A [bacterium]
MIAGLPLAAYLRPKKLEEVVGQTHILRSDSWLVQAIKNDRVSSLVFWGPPGSGKTTLAFLIA